MHPNEPCWVELGTEDSTTVTELFAKGLIEVVTDNKITVKLDSEQLSAQFGNSFVPDRVLPSNEYPDDEGVIYC